MLFSLFTFYRHTDLCEWYVSIAELDVFQYGDSLPRSLLLIGRRDKHWFVELFWCRVTPKKRGAYE